MTPSPRPCQATPVRSATPPAAHARLRLGGRGAAGSREACRVLATRGAARDGRFRKDGGGPRRSAGGLGREAAARGGRLPAGRAAPRPPGGGSGRRGAGRSGSGVVPRPRECGGARGWPHGLGAGTDGPLPPAAAEPLPPPTPGRGGVRGGGRSFASPGGRGGGAQIHGRTGDGRRSSGGGRGRVLGGRSPCGAPRSPRGAPRCPRSAPRPTRRPEALTTGALQSTAELSLQTAFLKIVKTPAIKINRLIISRLYDQL